ncbi:MAG: transcription termination factor NusA [Eubacteriales bacterium]|nr:transcription termination factor NusA [Eubacteriales bacterium]
MNNEFMTLLDELEKSKGISKEALLEAIEQAVISAYKRHYGSFQEIRVVIDRDSGKMCIMCKVTVVDEVFDPEIEISLDEAREISPLYEIDDQIEIERMPETFGRIAAQTARQIIVQKMREGERSMIFNKFSDKEGQIVSGIIKGYDKKNVVVDVAGSDASLPTNEQVMGETYTPGKRMRFIVSAVNRTTKGPQVFVSRSHPLLVRKMFETEIPEIQTGVIEIKSVSREPGQRTKIAVCSSDENVDAIGSCIGSKGSRVQAIVDELNGEKIDIVKYSDDVAEYVSAALSPAKVTSSTVNEEDKICNVIVPDNQLSLAIGKEGQNARLAAKLTGWKIDIKSESYIADGGEEE